jgi:hypothetical protein
MQKELPNDRANRGGGSHLDVGGETTMGKEASTSFFLLIGGGEREGEWSRSRMLATADRRLTGLAEPRRGVRSLAPCH